MRRPQFRLRSLFILTAIVAVGCLVAAPVAREVLAMYFASTPPNQLQDHWEFSVRISRFHPDGGVLTQKWIPDTPNITPHYPSPR